MILLRGALVQSLNVRQMNLGFCFPLPHRIREPGRIAQ